MQRGRPIGLVKFFRDEYFLDCLMGGLIHCQTPEYYRQSKQEGVSDMHESCAFAWRSKRGDAPILAEFDGHELIGLEALTIHASPVLDSWLSCWFMLELPQDALGLASLVEDIRRMKAEFGSSYALLPIERMQSFLDRLRSFARLPMWAEPVTYDDDRRLWSWKCKATVYRYQREYRFGFGDCPVTELQPHQFNCEGGLEEFLIKNPDLQIKHEQTGQVIFDLRAI